jgi:hypothetical protein
MKSVVLLATIHQNQILGNVGNTELAKRLEYLTSKFGVQTVMEEWSKTKEDSFAKSFAAKSGIHWADVGTPSEPQFKTYWGLIHFPGHDGTLEHDPHAPSLDEYGPFENQEARETWMAGKIQLAMETYEVGLLIFGVAHLHSLFAKLRSLGFKVTAYSWAGS